MKVIIDFDGTLTAEEDQVQALSERSLDTLAEEIIRAPRRRLRAAYEAARSQILNKPHAFGWHVNGLMATYSNEGAFILNTTTLQIMLYADDAYLRAVTAAYPNAEYHPVVDCTNDLFHRHTAELSPAFRPAAPTVLADLIEREEITPIILTNSLGDKVQRQLATLDLKEEINVLGDTRQYEMDPSWDQRFSHPDLGLVQVWPLHNGYQADLRRPAYHRALAQAGSDGSQLVVVADTFSMPGALPLMMGIPFFLLRTPYTPSWCIRAVKGHPLGHILETLSLLPAALDKLQSSGGDSP